ncbi:MAG: hypothetical protein DHS20C07_17590 [Methyloligella sp.]|nr:MAG: hypothetical protein DHS20C07_17590 [Methyloligella sp.]
MTESNALPLPKPWRLFFYDNRTIETSGQFYQALTNAFLSRQKTQISNELCQYWEASQAEGLIKLGFEDEKELKASYQIIGTFDGTSFLWGDENPSLDGPLVQDAKNFRETLRDKGYSLASEAKFKATARDGVALLSLAAQELSSQCCFTGPSGKTLIFMTLSGIEKNSDKTITERLFKPRTPSPFDLMQEIINNQIADLQPNDQELASIEASLNQAFLAYQTHDYAEVLNLITTLKKHLGKALIDMEPAGWLYLCEGSTLLALGEKEEAVTAFENAGRTIRTFDNTVRMLGLSRSVRSTDEKQSNLYGAYIRNSDRFLEIANKTEQDNIRSKLETFLKNRSLIEDTPQETWREALTSYRDLEKNAYELSKEISNYRNQTEIYYDKYRSAQHNNNLAWRNFCLMWMTPNRNSMLGSYASEPSHCPDLETITDITMIDDCNCSISTERDDRGSTNNFRYELTKTTPPLASHPRWLLSKVWSVWPDEEILLFE